MGGTTGGSRQGAGPREGTVSHVQKDMQGPFRWQQEPKEDPDGGGRKCEGWGAVQCPGLWVIWDVRAADCCEMCRTSRSHCLLLGAMAGGGQGWQI